MFKKEKRVAQKKIKIKPSVYQLAEELAELTLPFSEDSGINDYLERIIIIEAAQYGILPKEEREFLYNCLNPSFLKPTQTNEPIGLRPGDEIETDKPGGLPLGKLSNSNG